MIAGSAEKGADGPGRAWTDGVEVDIGQFPTEARPLLSTLDGRVGVARLVCSLGRGDGVSWGHDTENDVGLGDQCFVRVERLDLRRLYPIESMLTTFDGIKKFVNEWFNVVGDGNSSTRFQQCR